MPASKTFQLPTLRLHYLEWGRRDAPPLVLLHGGLDNAHSWTDLAGLLAADWRVLALDLRGHGDSEWSASGDYAPAAYMADMLRFLRDCAGFPATVVAHSMGARLSLQLMGAVPEAIGRLVAIEGLGGEGVPEPDRPLDAGMQAWLENRRARAARGPVDQLGGWLRARMTADRRVTVHADLESRIVKQMRDPKKQLTRAQAEAFVRSNMREAPGGWAWKFDPLTRWHTANDLLEPQRPFWSAIAGPVLHLYGARSWAYPPPAGDVAAFRHGRLQVIQGAGHWAHINQPQAVARAIGGFLAETAAQASGDRA